VAAAKQSAFDKNNNSCSNGCMMRCTPLAIFGQSLTKEEFRKLSDADCELTHSNQTAKDVTFLYNYAIK